jgi:hypothetical protein
MHASGKACPPNGTIVQIRWYHEYGTHPEDCRTFADASKRYTHTHRALVLVSTSAALYTGGWSYGRSGKEQIFFRKHILGIRRTEINLPTRVCVYGCGPLYCPGGVYLLLDVIAAHVCISVQLYNSYSLLRQLP